MGSKRIYFCDCCNKEVNSLEELYNITLPDQNWDRDVEWNNYEVCKMCYLQYEREMFKVKNIIKNKLKLKGRYI